MKDKDFNEFLEDRVDDWHDNKTTVLQLHDYLRMTWEEYGTWVSSGKLPSGIKSRWGFKEG